MPSAWIQHVKRYASHNNITYKEALKLSKPSYSKYGVVSTEPSMIKLNLNDDQYNLTPLTINPSFKKGSHTTHNVNIKYNSYEAISDKPNTREQLQQNLNVDNEIIEPTKTRNKFIINEAKHKKNIQKIEAKYAKIKNTDMSKYLNKKPVTIKANEPKKNDSFSFLYEPTRVEIPKLSFNAPYNKLVYEEGIVPYTNIIIPKFKSPDEEINIYNTMIIKYQNLVIVLLASKMPEDDKEILLNECRENIKSLKDKILKIKGEHTSDKPIYSKFEKVKRPARKLPTSDYTKAKREQSQMGMNDINVNAKPIYSKFEKVKRPARKLPTSDYTKAQREQAQMGMEDINVSYKPVNKKTQVPIIQDEDQNEEIINYFNDAQYMDFRGYFNDNADLYALEDIVDFINNDDMSNRNKVSDLIRHKKIYDNIGELASKNLRRLQSKGGTEIYKIKKLENIEKTTSKYKKRIYKVQLEIGQEIGEEEIEADDKKLKKRDKQVTTIGQNEKQEDFIDELINLDNLISSFKYLKFKTKNDIQKYFIGLQNKIIEKKREISKSNLSLNDIAEQHKKYNELQTKLDKYVDILLTQFLSKKKREKKN